MRRLTEPEKEKIIELYNLGKMDTEIGKELGVSDGTIFSFRKRNNLPTKFTYSKISKIDNNKFEELFNKGLSDYKIAKELNMSPDGVYSYRMRHNYLRNNNLRLNSFIELTQFQKEVLLGTLLGDASLKFGEKSKSPSIQCAHGIQQKEYCEHKTEIFKTLNAHCEYHKRNVPDKRTGKLYEDYTMYIPANPALLSWYKSFYTPKKVIPFDLFEYFTEVSLAFLYMDDGYKTGKNYCISTNCFSKESLLKFINVLKNKFNLDCTLLANNVIYIRANSRNLFTTLIKPYIIPSMQYKLQM